MINNLNQGVVEKAVEDENEVMIKYLLDNGYIKDPNFKFTPGQFDFSYENEEEDSDDNMEESEEGTK